jgi:hypothetical protein
VYNQRIENAKLREEQEKLRQELQQQLEEAKGVGEHQRIENAKLQEEQKELRGNYEALRQQVEAKSQRKKDRQILKDKPTPITPRGALEMLILLFFESFVAVNEAYYSDVISMNLSELWLPIRCLAYLASQLCFVWLWGSFATFIGHLDSKKEIPSKIWLLHIFHILSGWICLGLRIASFSELPLLVRWWLFLGVSCILFAAGWSFVQDVKWGASGNSTNSS